MPHHPVQTPQLKTQALPQDSPSQASPSTRPPAKQPVVKALPTVRDHTTDQLGPEGDEYIPREVDPAGDEKVSKDGHPLGGRKYKCRTFEVPNRGRKLFMLATECARVLSYRDSYLLFNKNRSLFKIIASQNEKDNLIQQEILPYSYRSRQIAIVTARSMFRQFGSRLIVDGRRVRDDYWEAKARKQGFTEEDAAGEKRPGLTKSRQEAAEQQATVNLTSLPQGEIIYSNSGPGFEAQQPPSAATSSLTPLPMIHIPAEELRPNMMNNYTRPRQDVSAAASYTDRIQPSTTTEMLSQVTNAAESNKQLKESRQHREAYLKDYWNRPHEQPAIETALNQNDLHTVAPQNLHSPQVSSSLTQARSQQEPISHPTPQYTPQSYPTYPSQQAQQLASPVQTLHRNASANQMHPSSPALNMGNAHRQTPSYGNYGQGQMWQQQAQASPLPQPHLSSYGQQQHQHQQPQPQPQPQQHHHQQQQHQQHQPSQQHHQQAHQHHHQQQQPQHAQMQPPQLQQPGMNYTSMNQMAQPGYPGMARGMYQQNPGQQQYGMAPQSGSTQPSMHGWNQPGSGSGSSNMQQNYQYQ
jgi:hypothetical protein